MTTSTKNEMGDWFAAEGVDKGRVVILLGDVNGAYSVSYLDPAFVRRFANKLQVLADEAEEYKK